MDQKALVTLLIGNNKKNKTIFSRLTRWIEKVILFDYKFEQMPGAEIVLADYLSRYPVGDASRGMLTTKSYCGYNPVK